MSGLVYRFGLLYAGFCRGETRPEIPFRLNFPPAMNLLGDDI